jgi:solute carrier family 35 (UDP-sugar transporter), member A1/2/3
MYKLFAYQHIFFYLVLALPSNLQIVFKKTLSRRQWLSLIILTLGCMVKQINFGPNPSVESSSTTKSALNQKNTNGFDFSMSAVLIMLQVVCSCLAGVYNEYLLKDKGSNVDIYIQNVFMYLDSIVCNLLLLVLQGDLFSAFTSASLAEVVKLPVLVIMFNNCAIGIVTSFFLKHMNSILKTFAGALELLFTSVLCYFLFAIPIYLNTILSIVIVSGAVYFYSLNPVVNLGVAGGSSGKDRLALLNHKGAGSDDDDEDFELQMETV